MGQDTTYEAILVPQGTTLGEANDTRSLALDLDANSGKEKQYDAVREYIRKETPVDPQSFRNYWEIAVVRPVEHDAYPSAV